MRFYNHNLKNILQKKLKKEKQEKTLVLIVETK